MKKISIITASILLIATSAIAEGLTHYNVETVPVDKHLPSLNMPSSGGGSSGGGGSSVSGGGGAPISSGGGSSGSSSSGSSASNWGGGSTGAPSISTPSTLGTKFQAKSTESVSAVDATSYQIALGKIGKVDMTMSSNPAAVMVGWYDLFSSNAITKEEKSELAWIFAGVNYLNDYTVKKYSVKNLYNAIAFDEKMFADKVIIEELSKLINNINRPYYFENFTEFSEERSEMASKAAGDHMNVLFLGSLENVVIPKIQTYSSDMKNIGPLTQGAFGAVVPVTPYSKYINTPFRQNMSVVDKIRLSIVLSNRFTGDGNGKYADKGFEVSELYDYLNGVFIMTEKGEMIPFGTFWKAEWIKTLSVKKDTEQNSSLENDY